MQNALALEYQADYGTARRDLDVADLVNNPLANGVCRVSGLSFEEKRLNLMGIKMGAFFDDRADPFLIRP